MKASMKSDNKLTFLQINLMYKLQLEFENYYKSKYDTKCSKTKVIIKAACFKTYFRIVFPFYLRWEHEDLWFTDVLKENEKETLS